MKRIIALLLLIVMAVCMLASCDDGGSSNKPKDTTPVTPIGGDDPEEENWWDDLDFEKETLTIQLSHVDTDGNNRELPVGCDQYMKGPDTQLDSGDTFDKVQNAVYLRNKACCSESGLNLKLAYTYITDDWGSIKTKIINQESAYGSDVKVDIYCDMQYDMFGAACVNATFANILNSTVDTGEGYFDFQKSKGYYIDYMQDNTLSDTRLCIIASDYFMDILRAMIILPFNSTIFENKVVTDTSAETSVEDFYDMIENGEWTWDKLMSYNNVWDGTGTASTEDETLLMVLTPGGITANGFLYSTKYETYTTKTIEGVDYPEFKSNCTEIISLFQKAAEVASTPGVIADADTLGGSNNITLSNQLFTSGNVLFGTLNILGIIESESFQSMSSGLSIIPVPKLTVNDESATVLSSRARVGALSFHTDKRWMASAFIQYQTENSTEVKEEYFQNAMTGKYLAGSGAGRMLNLIYDNIGSNKSSTLDNLTRSYNWKYNDYVFGQMVLKKGFGGSASSISSEYSAAVEAKNTGLKEAVWDWRHCED